MEMGTIVGVLWVEMGNMVVVVGVGVVVVL